MINFYAVDVISSSLSKVTFPLIRSFAINLMEGFFCIIDFTLSLTYFN